MPLVLVVSSVGFGALALFAGHGCGTSEIDGRIGARCVATIDCAERCLPPSDDHPGGFCTVSCTSDRDCGKGGAACVADEGGICLFTCRDDRDCGFLNGADTGAWVCKERDAMGGGSVRVCRGE
jgi:hypothetical protein